VAKADMRNWRRVSLKDIKAIRMRKP